MKSLKFLGVFLLFLFVALPSQAAEFESKDEYTVETGQVVSDDVYVAGDDIKINGLIEGDLVAAGNVVEINGEVRGDVTAFASRVIINGIVGDDVHAGAQDIVIRGSVAGDVIAGSATLTVSESGVVGGDITAGSGEIDLDGKLEGSMLTSGGVVDINGEVLGSVDVKQTGELIIGRQASVAGDLNYQTESMIDSEEAERVVGSIVYDEPMNSGYEKDSEKSLSEKFAASMGWRVFVSLSLILIGVLTILVTPRRARQVVREKMRASFGKNLLVGFAVYVLTPVAALLLMLTIIGIPVGLFLLFFYIMLVIIAALPLAFLVGDKVLSGMKTRNAYASMILGIIIVEFCFGLLSLIPFFGSLVIWLAQIWGIGVLVLTDKAVMKGLDGKEKKEPKTSSM